MHWLRQRRLLAWPRGSTPRGQPVRRLDRSGPPAARSNNNLALLLLIVRSIGPWVVARLLHLAQAAPVALGVQRELADGQAA